MSDIQVTSVSYDPADWGSSITSGGFSISLPFDDIIISNSHPVQQDLFKHFVTSQWIPFSSMPEEDNCDDYIVNHIKSLPYLAEAWHDESIEYSINHDTRQADIFYVGNELDHCAWRIRWSEYFETRNTNLII
jgi:hypothetical protein